MNSEQKERLEEEVKFAAIGQQVLNNEAYKTAITVRKTQIFDVFCRTKADQSDIREEAWRTKQNLLSLEDFLKNALTTGEMADKTLESLNNH